MPVDALSLLSLFGLTIIIGYVGTVIFNKTGISDIVWLLLFGILLGPVFGLVDRGLFLAIAPFLAAIALLVILFDAGLNMNFYQLVRGFPRSILLGVANVALAIVAVSVLANWLLGLDYLLGALLGAIVGGTSSAIVISMASRSAARLEIKTLINLESVFTDPLVIVVSIALINIALAQSYSALQGILSAFSVGAVIGIILGVVWLFVLDRLKGKPFDYMLTLAALFLVYVLVESAAGSGAVASLFFGLVLGNGATFSRILKIKKRAGADPLLKSFQSEVSFFIRSFFFVFLGIIVLINFTYALYGVAIAIALIIMRLAAVQLSIIGLEASAYEKNMMRSMAPRGLAAAVLAQLPAAAGIAEAAIFPDIVFTVILATVIYTTVAARYFGKGRAGNDERAEKTYEKAKKKAERDGRRRKLKGEYLG